MSLPLDPEPRFTSYAHPEKLVSAGWLSARLGTTGLAVVESDSDGLLYDIGHLPQAVRIDWKKELTDPTRRDIITPEHFAQLMDAKGIGPDDTVVIYGDKANLWAAYTMWVFEIYGHKDVRMLDGGRDAWIGEERDTSFVVPEHVTTGYPVRPREDTDHRIFVHDLTTHLADHTLIDVRTPAEYEGETTGDPYSTHQAHSIVRGGHIPTALNIPWEQSVHPNSCFKSATDLKKLYKAVPKTDPVVCYCRTGDRSAHTWFVLKYLLGYDTVRNYDGSWVEWGNMIGMPIATGPLPS